MCFRRTVQFPTNLNLTLNEMDDSKIDQQPNINPRHATELNQWRANRKPPANLSKSKATRIKIKVIHTHHIIKTIEQLSKHNMINLECPLCTDISLICCYPRHAYPKSHPYGTRANCNICGRLCVITFTCPNEHTGRHPNGFNYCFDCGLKRLDLFDKDKYGKNINSKNNINCNKIENIFIENLYKTVLILSKLTPIDEKIYQRRKDVYAKKSQIFKQNDLTKIFLPYENENNSISNNINNNTNSHNSTNSNNENESKNNNDKTSKYTGDSWVMDSYTEDIIYESQFPRPVKLSRKYVNDQNEQLSGLFSLKAFNDEEAGYSVWRSVYDSLLVKIRKQLQHQPSGQPQNNKKKNKNNRQNKKDTSTSKTNNNNNNNNKTDRTSNQKTPAHQRQAHQVANGSQKSTTSKPQVKLERASSDEDILVTPLTKTRQHQKIESITIYNNENNVILDGDGLRDACKDMVLRVGDGGIHEWNLIFLSEILFLNISKSEKLDQLCNFGSADERFNYLKLSIYDWDVEKTMKFYDKDEFCIPYAIGKENLRSSHNTSFKVNGCKDEKCTKKHDFCIFDIQQECNTKGNKNKNKNKKKKKNKKKSKHNNNNDENKENKEDSNESKTDNTRLDFESKVKLRHFGAILCEYLAHLRMVEIRANDALYRKQWRSHKKGRNVNANSLLFAYYGSIAKLAACSMVDYLKCENYFLHSIKITEKNDFALIWYAQFLEQYLQKYDKCSIYFEKALNISKRSSHYHRQYAKYLFNRKEYLKSSRYYDITYRLEHWNYDRHMSGLALYRNGSYDNASIKFREIIFDTMGSIINNNSDIPKHDNLASLMANYTTNSRGELIKKAPKKEKKLKDKTLVYVKHCYHNCWITKFSAAYCHVIKGFKNEYKLEAKWTFMREDGDDRKFLTLITGYLRREYFSESGYDPYFYVKFVKKYIGNDRDLFYKGFDIISNILESIFLPIKHENDNENENDNDDEFDEFDEFGTLAQLPVVPAHPPVNPYNHVWGSSGDTAVQILNIDTNTNDNDDDDGGDGKIIKNEVLSDWAMHLITFEPELTEAARLHNLNRQFVSLQMNPIVTDNNDEKENDNYNDNDNDNGNENENITIENAIDKTNSLLSDGSYYDDENENSRIELLDVNDVTFKFGIIGLRRGRFVPNKNKEYKISEMVGDLGKNIDCMFYYLDFRSNGQRYFYQCKTTLEDVAKGVERNGNGNGNGNGTNTSNIIPNGKNLKKGRIRSEININDTISICIYCRHSGVKEGKSGGDLVESKKSPAYFISCWINSKKMREVPKWQINSKEFLYFTLFGTNSINCRFRLFPQ